MQDKYSANVFAFVYFVSDFIFFSNDCKSRCNEGSGGWAQWHNYYYMSINESKIPLKVKIALKNEDLRIKLLWVIRIKI